MYHAPDVVGLMLHKAAGNGLFQSLDNYAKFKAQAVIVWTDAATVISHEVTCGRLRVVSPAFADKG